MVSFPKNKNWPSQFGRMLKLNYEIGNSGKPNSDNKPSKYLKLWMAYNNRGRYDEEGKGGWWGGF